jgi:hypothetical protein
MIDPLNIPPVADNELLARFIVNSNERRSDGSVTPKLFLPYSRVDLSVNRHRDATEEETWSIGRKVAAQRGKTLYGRADIRATACRISPLDVLPRPILPENPNHADIVGFPLAKEDQLSLAEKLAASIEGKWILPPSEGSESVRS